MTNLAPSPVNSNSGHPSELIPKQDTFQDALRWGDTLYMANGLQYLAQETIEVEGVDTTVDLVGVILLRPRNTPSDNKKELLLTRPVGEPGDPLGPLTLYSVDRKEDKTVSRKAIMIDESGPFKIGTGDETITFVPHDSKHRGWPSIRAGSDLNATIVVSEASQPLREQPHEANEKLARRRKIKHLGAAGLAILAFKGVTAPGGVYDHVMDGRSGAYGFVESKLAHEEDEQLNSTTYGTLPNGQPLVLQGKDIVNKYRQSVDRVAQTMGDIDNHDFNSVINRAKDFERSQGKDILSEVEIKDYQDRLAKTKNTHEATIVMQKFLKRYDCYVTFPTDLSKKVINSSGFHSKVQEFGDVAIDLLGKLPRSLVKEAIGYQDVDNGGGIKFAFGSKESKVGNSLAYGETVAQWDGQYLTFFDDLKIFGAPMPGMSVKQAITHEFSHAALNGLLNYEGNKTKYGNMMTRAKNIGSQIIGSPDFTSDYSTANTEEESAEVGADIFMGDIPNPDHVLDFQSRANQSRLRAMVELDQKYPGITDYLIYRLHPGLLS